MFNFIHPSNDEQLLLYNSYVGFDSLSSISKTDYDYIRHSLNSESIDQIPQFQILKQLGYFVSDDTDEKSLRAQKLMDIVEENVLRLIILPTEKCNFRCKYCYETFEKGKMSAETQESLINYVRTNIHRFSSMEVNWFGGEPLEALDVVEHLSNAFIDICRITKRNYSASITTNAYNLTFDVFKKLCKLHVYRYQITIDGIQSVHDTQRVLINGKGTFNRIVSNLLSIKSETKSAVPRITIRTNFTKPLIQHLDEYLEFLYSKFSDDSRFIFSFQKAGDWGGDRVKEISNDLMDNNFYREILKKVVEKDIKLDMAAHGALLNGSTCVCYANKRHSFVIGSDGLIYKCSGDFKFKPNTIGYLHDGKMIIDDNIHVKWIFSISRDFHGCDDCFFSGACLFSSCPSSFIKGEKDQSDICLFEKDFIGYFLEMFRDKYLMKI